MDSSFSDLVQNSLANLEAKQQLLSPLFDAAKKILGEASDVDDAVKRLQAWRDVYSGTPEADPDLVEELKNETAEDWREYFEYKFSHRES